MFEHASPSLPTRPRVWTSAGVAIVLALLAVGLVAGPVAAAPAQASLRGSGTPAGRAWVRIAHLVPGLGAARIDLIPGSGATVTTVQMSPDAAYGDVTMYRQLTPGAYQVQVRLATSGSASAPMLSRTLTLQADKAYTLAVLGTPSAPRLATLSDDLTPPAANNARVRVLTAATQAPAVTVTAQKGPVIAENAVLGQASSYAAVPAGTWKLQTTASGRPPLSSSIAVAGGSVYTLLVLDGADGTPRLDLVTDAAGTSAAPRGGAQTGGGGTATSFVSTQPPRSHSVLLLSVLAVMLGAGSLLMTRRRPGRS